MGNGASIRIRGGSLYLDAELYDTYFRGQSALALLRRGDDIALLPLRQPGSGGLLVKMRNARGDRVIHAPEFLRELGVSESAEHELAVRWDPELSALTLPRLGLGRAVRPSQPPQTDGR